MFPGVIFVSLNLERCEVTPSLSSGRMFWATWRHHQASIATRSKLNRNAIQYANATDETGAARKKSGSGWFSKSYKIRLIFAYFRPMEFCFWIYQVWRSVCKTKYKDSACQNLCPKHSSRHWCTTLNFSSKQRQQRFRKNFNPRDAFPNRYFFLYLPIGLTYNISNLWNSAELRLRI